MGIKAQANFEIIDPQDKATSFLALVNRPRGRKIKASISLKKGLIRLKGDGNKLIVPIYPSKENLWEELDD